MREGVGGGRPPRLRIVLVECAHHLGDGEAIDNLETEHRHTVEGAAIGYEATGRNHAEGRLQTDDVVEGGWDAARTTGVGADREGSLMQANRHPRPPARPPAIHSFATP